MLEIKNHYEIERRFLVKYLPDLSDAEKADIVQYYLNDNVTRLRRMNDEYILTQKSGSGLMRTEIEYSIDKSQFDNLKIGAKTFITKTRYFYPLDNLTCEIDIFNGKFDGIIIAEIEFATIEQAKSYTPPDFLGAEITLDKKLSNKQMSKNPEKAVEYFRKIYAENV